MTSVLDAVAAAAAGVPRVYALGDVPQSPEYPYSVYSASLGRGATYLLDNTEGIRLGRIVTQSFGRTAASAEAHCELLRAALVNQVLAITGFATTALRSELDPSMTRDPDDTGVIGITSTLTFTATKEA